MLIHATDATLISIIILGLVLCKILQISPFCIISLFTFILCVFNALFFCLYKIMYVTNIALVL